MNSQPIEMIRFSEPLNGYGHSVAEVAQLLGVEVATAKTHLVRGLAHLRGLMADHR